MTSTIFTTRGFAFFSRYDFADSTTAASGSVCSGSAEKSAASFSMFLTIGASSFMRFWYLSACFCAFSASCRDSCKSSCKERISSSTCNNCSCKSSLISWKAAFSSCNFAFFASNSATSFALSFFSKSKTDKCFSCVPFFSHSIPCSSMTAASCSFS